MSKLIDVGSNPLIVPIVLPHSGDTSSGRVRNLPVSPQAMPRMLERRSTGFGVRGEYADKGYVMLRDLYVAEGNAAGWAKYERYLAAWANNTTRSPFPVADLPAEVRRRQMEPMADDEFADDFAAVKPTTGAVHPLPAARKAKPEAQP